MRARILSRAGLLAVLLGTVPAVFAVTLPDDVGVEGNPLANCTRVGAQITCNGDLEFTNQDPRQLVLAADAPRPITLTILGGDFRFVNNFAINDDGVASDLYIQIPDGAFNPDHRNATSLNAHISAQNIYIGGGNSTITGNLSATEGVYIDNPSTVTGNVEAGEVVVNDGTIIGDVTAPEIIDNGDIDGDVYCDIYNADGDPCQGAMQVPDHILLLHGGAGVTCMPAPVTVIACANDDCSEQFADSTTVHLSPAGGWATNPITFTGSTTAWLSITESQTVTLDATSEATHPTRCADGDGTASCQLQFFDVGIVMDGGGDEGLIPTQIAGKPSNQGYQAATQRVRVVRTDDQTGACVAAVGNGTHDVSFNYQLSDPPHGLGDNLFTITGAGSATLTAAASSQTIPLAFDGEGTAPFHFSARDAGRYRLQASMAIPIVDAEGEVTGTLAATGASTDFVVRPLAIFADAAGNPGATTAEEGPYVAAGATFEVRFRSLAWTAERDSTADGEWDACGSAIADPADQLARVPEWVLGQPAAQLVAPDPGTNGTLEWSDIPTFGAGSASVEHSASYSEVGIIQLERSELNDFLGEPVQVCSPPIGRFHPDHFTTAIADHGAFANVSGNFTYIGQGFGYAVSPAFTVTARNRADQPTRNYTGDFAFLDSGHIQLGYPHSDDSQTDQTEEALLAVTVSDSDLWRIDNGDGTLTFTLIAANDSFTYERAMGRVAPFTADLTIALNAVNDGEASANDLPRTITPAGNLQRFGRAVLADTYGRESEDQRLYFWTHYFDGTDFVINDDDIITQYSVLPENPSAPPDEPACQRISGSLQCEQVSVSGSAIAHGGFFSLAAPGAGNTGRLRYRLTVDNWLQYDWSDDGAYDQNPAASATFGIFRGDDRFIYWREVE